MALGDSYATEIALERRLGTTNDGSFQGLLDAASRIVERFCQRQFNAAASASAREFDPIDAQMLAVDDFHTSSGLAIDIDGDAVSLSDVRLEPRNGIMEGQTGWPYFQIVALTYLWPTEAWYRPWPANPPVVTVTAQWGWASVPAAIVEATLDVAEFLSVGGGVGTGKGGGVVQSETVGDYSVSFFGNPLVRSSDVPRVLAKAAPYRRARAGIA